MFVGVHRWVWNREGCKEIGYLLDARELLSTRRGANRGNQLGELLVNSSNLFSWHRLLKSSGNAVATLGGFGGGIHRLRSETNGVLVTATKQVLPLFVRGAPSAGRPSDRVAGVGCLLPWLAWLASLAAAPSLFL